MYLFVDTETTGKIQDKETWDSPNQPYIVQMAMILTDGEGTTKAEFQSLIKPNGWEISTEAQMIHGISTKMCEAYGITQSMAINLYWRLSAKARMTIAHNAWFDSAVIRTNTNRCGMPVPFMKTFCTMKATTEICKLPGRYGNYKWPKLEEAYQIIFNEKLEGAHDAMNDVRGCKRLFFHLQSLQTEPLRPNGPT